MKNILFTLIIAFNSLCYSQSYVTSFPFVIKKDGKSFNYVDESKDEVYVFISNGKKVRLTHYDNKFNLLDTLTTTIPGKKSDNIIGFNKNESNINLIWTTDNGEKFIFQNLDLKSKKVVITVKEMNFNRQNVIQTFSTNDAFYCLVVGEYSNLLRLYRFSNQSELLIKDFNFSSTNFFDSNNQKVSLYDLFNESFDSFESAFEIQNINHSLPNSLSICAKKRKSYLLKNELILTFDNHSQSTQLIKINLNDYSSEAIKIYKPEEKVVTNQSNSYFFDQHLYQFKVTNLGLFLTIKNLKGELIKEFTVNSNADINFKNSDFLCEWINKFNEKKIENTNQFVSKLSSYKVGISCYNYKDKNLISFGGVSPEQIKKIDINEVGSNINGIPLAPYGSGALGGLLFTTTYVLLGGYDGNNYFYNNYKSNRNIISVNTLLSKSFEQELELVNQYSGSKMCSHFNGFAEIKYPIFFSTGSKAYVGYYNEDAKQYVIMKFEN